MVSLARGVLARSLGAVSKNSREKLDQERFKILGLDALSEADQEIIQRVEKVAKDHNVSMAVVATAWVIGKGFNPIVGLSSVKRVDDILQALKFKLTKEEEKFLEEPYVPKNVTA